MGKIDEYLPEDLLSADPVSMDKNIIYPDKNCVKYIFYDNYEKIVEIYNTKMKNGEHKIRPYCFDQIQKCILCGSMDLGYTVYECQKCGRYTIIPNRCHSRFCSSCAVKKAKETAIEISNIALDCKHRHVVLTIPMQLRNYFLKNRELLNILFIAARNTIYDVANNRKYRKAKRKKAKSKNPYKACKKKNKKCRYDYKDAEDIIMPGFIATLHTFGRSLQWNPHMHLLVCEKVYDKKADKMKTLSFPYEKIRKTWMFQVLDLLSRSEVLKNDREFKQLKNYLYNTYTDGFYINCPDKNKNVKDDENMDDEDFKKISDNIKGVVGYITRYTSRPVIADSRIDCYDESTHEVTWHYTAHEDDELHVVKQPAMDFILSVIRHCPDKNFKMTRRYGFYSNASSKYIDRIYEVFGKQIRRHLKSKKQRMKSIERSKRRTKFRPAMISSFNRDPIKCKCGNIMVATCDYNPYVKGANNELPNRNQRNKAIFRNISLRLETERRHRESIRSMGRRLDRRVL